MSLKQVTVEDKDNIQLNKPSTSGSRMSKLDNNESSERENISFEKEGYDLLLLNQPLAINYLSYSFDRLVATTASSKKGSNENQKLDRYKKVDEEIRKLLSNYYQTYGFTAGTTNSSESHGFSSTYTTNLVNTFRNVTYFSSNAKTQRDNLVSPSIPSTPNTNLTEFNMGMSSNINGGGGNNFYTKTLHLLQNALNKGNKGSSRSTATVNNMLFPRPRRVLNYLYLPFASRPLNEVNCRQAITAIQTLMVDYPTDSIAHISHLISWYLAALNTTSPMLKDLIIERLTQLIMYELEKNEVKLLEMELSTIVYHLLQHLSLTSQLSNSSPQRSEANTSTRQKVDTKVDKLLKSVAEFSDRQLDDHFGSKSQGMFTIIQSFAKLLGDPSQPIQQFALTTLLKETWPDAKIPLARPFYAQFAASAHYLFSSYVTAGDPSLAANALQVLQLMGTNYPPNHLPTDIHDRSTWYLVARSALLAFAIGINHTDQLDRPTSSVMYLETRSSTIRKSRQYLQALLDCGGNDLVIRALDDLIRTVQLPVVLSIYSQVVFDTLHNEVAESVLDRTLPTLYERCFDDHLVNLYDSLRNFLMQVKMTFPKALYKPVLKLIPKTTPADAYRLLVYLKLLETSLTCETLYLTELDLISVILFSQLNPKVPVTLGQTVFLSRVVYMIDGLKMYSEFQKQSAEYLIALKALLDLEKQITMLILARRKLNAAPLHPITKALIVNVLVGVRHLTQPKRRLGWIGTIVEWVDTQNISSSTECYLDYDFDKLSLDLKQVNALELERNRILPVYQRLATVKLPDAIYRQNGLVVSTNFNQLHRNLTFGKDTDKTDLNNFDKLLRNPAATVFKLLAAVYFHLTESEYLQLIPTLHLHGLSSQSADRASAQLLYLLAGERVAQPTVHFTLHQLDPSYHLTDAVDQLHFIFLARRSLLSLLKVVDIDDKPFRKWHVNLPFVPTAVGTHEPVLDRSIWLDKLRRSGTSLDEIRMIQSLGWDNDPEQEEEVSFQVGNRPVTLASTTFQEIYTELVNDVDDDRSQITKRKPLFTGTVCQLLTGLIDHLNLNLNLVSTRLRELCFKMMRDEPAWLLRLVFNQSDPTIDTDPNEVDPITRLNQLVQLKPKLPFLFAYHAFNYLLGYLKFGYRDHALQSLQVAVGGVGVLSRLLKSTVDVTLREIRKLKLDSLLLTDGTLLLKPNNPFFKLDPNTLAHLIQPDLELGTIPQLLLELTALRITQINFMANLLRMTPHDVNLIIKYIAKYQPLNVALIEEPALQVINYTKLKTTHPDLASTLASISALGCHAWLSLLEVSFQSVDPNLQDRDGLQVLLEGVNTILRAHPHHLPLVGRACRLLVNVAMQFRRLFNINAGYSLFMVGLFETYHLSKSTDIKLGIEMVICRFFNLHTDSFVFQMLGDLIPYTISRPDVDAWTASLFKWFEALQSPPDLDSFNILKQRRYNLNLANKRSHSKLDLAQYLSQRTKQLYNDDGSGIHKRFQLDSTLKLLVTIIAYDPNSLRSQQFVTVLAYLLKFFLRSANTNQLIDLAVKSILPIFKRLSKRKPKLISWISNSNSNNDRDAGNAGGANNLNKMEDNDLDYQLNQTYGKQWLHNDTVSIRIQLFKLVGNSVQLGGSLDQQQLDDLLYILKSIIKSDHPLKLNHDDTVDGPLTTFVICLILGQTDAELKLKLSTRTFHLINTYLDAFKSCYRTIDLLTATNHLIQCLGTFRLDLPLSTEQATSIKVLTKAHQIFTDLSTNPATTSVDSGEDLKRLGAHIAKLVEVLLPQFPDELAFQLKTTSVHTDALLHVWLPFIQNTHIDDAYLTKNTDPILRSGVQRFWLVLVSKLFTTLDSTTSRSLGTTGSYDDTTDYLLVLAALKLTLSKLNSNLYRYFPTLQSATIRVLQDSVFNPYFHYSTDAKLDFKVYRYAVVSITLLLVKTAKFNWLLPHFYDELDQVCNGSNNFNHLHTGSSFNSAAHSPSLPSTHHHNSIDQNLSLNPNLLNSNPNSQPHSPKLNSPSSKISTSNKFSKRLSNFKSSLSSNSNSNPSNLSASINDIMETTRANQLVQQTLDRLQDKVEGLFVVLKDETSLDDEFDEVRFLTNLLAI